MAWIESHQELAHHPKVARLAHALDVSVPTAIGHLHCLWWWCLAYAEDGELDGFSAFEIAHAAQWQEEPDVFVEALGDAGWLDDTRVHDWHEYGGKLAERRRQDAERKRKARAKTSTHRPSDSPSDSPPDDRTDGARRQQHTTEDNNASSATDGFTAFNAKRAVAVVDHRIKQGLPVKNRSGLAKTIAEDPEHVAESQRIWAHRDCTACKGKGFTEEYAPGAGTRKVKCESA